MRIDLDDGKYTYVMDNGKQYALRYGELWKDLSGDKFVYAMACKIEDLESQLHAHKKKEMEEENHELIIKSADYSYDVYCEDYEPNADRNTFIDGFINGIRWKEKQSKIVKGKLR